MLGVNICYITGFIILLLYIIYIIWKDKCVPQSISATVYSLDEKNRWLFGSVIGLIGILIAPGLFEILSTTNYIFLAFLTIVGIFGVASDPLMHNEKNVIHYVSAILMGASSQLIVYITNAWLMALWLPYICYTMYMENGKWNMIFAEAVMMTGLFLCIFL